MQYRKICYIVKRDVAPMCKMVTRLVLTRLIAISHVLSAFSGRQTDRQTDRQIDRWTDKAAYRDMCTSTNKDANKF